MILMPPAETDTYMQVMAKLVLAKAMRNLSDGFAGSPQPRPELDEYEALCRGRIEELVREEQAEVDRLIESTRRPPS